MDIFHLSSEFAPLAKVGGLADVVYGLAKETAKAGHTVEVMLPKYDTLNTSFLKDLKIAYPDLISYDGPYQQHNTIWAASFEGIQLWLLESHHPDHFFERGKIYGCPDDLQRFIYFTRTALEFLFKREKAVDALHLHDWPVALASVLYKEMYLPLGLKVGGTVFTVHNLEHQGKCPQEQLSRCGLDFFRDMQDPVQPHLLNLLKGGLLYSDFITTVSPTYAQEITHPVGGCGLHSTLEKRQKTFQGILNGIETTYWDPTTDPYLASRYTLENYVKGKEANKEEIRRRFGMRKKAAPLLCSISRLVAQKSPHLIKYALERALELGGQFILLGSAPDPLVDLEFRALQQKLEGNPDVAFYFEYDESLAHLTYAASDMIIVPSLFEPCGLTQLISMRYGTVPLVRKTGGLADTVFENQNGFTFEFPDCEGVKWALDRAFDTYFNQPRTWRRLIQHGFEADVSWRKSAQAYFQVYERFSTNLKKTG